MDTVDTDSADSTNGWNSYGNNNMKEESNNGNYDSDTNTMGVIAER